MEQGKEAQTNHSEPTSQHQTSESHQSLPQTPPPGSVPTTEKETAPQGDTLQRSTSMSRWKATVLLFGGYAIVWGVFFGVVLHAIGKLPYPALAVASAVEGLLVVSGGVWVFFFGQPGERERNWLTSNFRNIWRQAHRIRAAIAGPIAAIIILVIPSLLVSQTVGIAPVATATPTTNSTVIVPTPTQVKWVSVLKQPAPNCNNPQGVQWHVYTDTTRYFCFQSGAEMQQTSPKGYGEMDLTQVNGISYNQLSFQLQVQVAFQNPGDITTWAALIFQTPAAVGVPGGYIFTLSPDGHWELQYVVSYQTINIVAQGSMSIGLHQIVTMKVIVLNGELYAYINDQQVTAQADALGTVPSDVGLIVERQNAAPSSLVQYSNFELDKAD